ncbi:bifunctional hydroxymethylpyrimidine kinase/phosphomethylpyrimidine kinase [Lampropedia puyangensis]|uniref:hydroxymethylpyrimidine kinase n=1 Tax=Lampropedia puyangensis TaxID=1330072 RepID=A0A4S8F9X2_9BURK|nr:bifunctional hydroxymethylpyrimidine kinase/phosphomethylpyrimidine kinase [Lampropedia puyangensis]THU04067.1 bifunctional hydroxymethylpyrimidine kinase/phosphomethylpyrimidine kinase [Lampropedia puyangensis]
MPLTSSTPSASPTHTTSVPRVLSIAGTDPTGGAGIHADLKSISANGGYGMAVVTALVAQNTKGVRSIHTPPVSFLREQLDSVSDDVQIDAIKIGMLGTSEIIETISEWLDINRAPVVVLDPVMVATSGDRLLNAQAEAALRQLLHKADLITPNMPELAVLAQTSEAQNWQEVLEQARAVAAQYQAHVLAKGGHLSGHLAPDALINIDGTVQEFPGDRIATKNTHGTGCSYSAALATLRPQVNNWAEAIALAKSWLTESIRHADSLHVGRGHGPIHHFASLWQRAGQSH